MISGISKPIVPSAISVKPMSAAPRFPTSLIRGRHTPPLPEVNCRTRREIRLTRTCGLTTTARALLTRSAFIYFVAIKLLEPFSPRHMGSLRPQHGPATLPGPILRKCPGDTFRLWATNSPECAMGCRRFPRPASLGHATRAGFSRIADEPDLYAALDRRAHRPRTAFSQEAAPRSGAGQRGQLVP